MVDNALVEAERYLVADNTYNRRLASSRNNAGGVCSI